MTFLRSLVFDDAEQSSAAWEGLKPREDWKRFDSSKLLCYMECPRRYFYQYVCGWQPANRSNHLVFGQAWHEAMEHLLLHGYNEASISQAYDKFLACYRQHFPASSDELYAPKTPTNAHKALVLYCERYKDEDADLEVLHTEMGGRLALDGSDPNMSIIYKMDAVVRQHDEVFVLEHKTKGGSFNQRWADQWRTSFQVGTYTFSAHCLYEEATNVVINGVGFLRTRIDFMRVPIVKTEVQMQNWLRVACNTIRKILIDLEILEECLERKAPLYSFDMNPTSCTRYYGCPYVDLCLSWGNPLEHVDRLPAGFEFVVWNPLERVKNIRDIS